MAQTRPHNDRSDDSQHEQGTEATRNPRLRVRKSGQNSHHDDRRADGQGTPGGTVHRRPALEPPVDRRDDALDHTQLIPDFGSALDVVSSSRLDDVSGAAAASDDRTSVAWPFTVTTVSSPASLLRDVTHLADGVESGRFGV